MYNSVHIHCGDGFVSSWIREKHDKKFTVIVLYFMADVPFDVFLFMFGSASLESEESL